MKCEIDLVSESGRMKPQNYEGRRDVSYYRRNKNQFGTFLRFKDINVVPF